MPQVEARMLIAKWKPEQDCSVELPHTIYWSDSSPATTEDYLAHLADTHTFTMRADGIALHMYPDLAVDVHYDPGAQQWMVSGHDVEPVALDISDHNAPDDAIFAALATRTIVYRVRRIHRHR
jgi:hypothetical protein